MCLNWSFFSASIYLSVLFLSLRVGLLADRSIAHQMEVSWIYNRALITKDSLMLRLSRSRHRCRVHRLFTIVIMNKVIIVFNTSHHLRCLTGTAPTVKVKFVRLITQSEAWSQRLLFFIHIIVADEFSFRFGGLGFLFFLILFGCQQRRWLRLDWELVWGVIYCHPIEIKINVINLSMRNVVSLDTWNRWHFFEVKFLPSTRVFRLFIWMFPFFKVLQVIVFITSELWRVTSLACFWRLIIKKINPLLTSIPLSLKLEFQNFAS